MLQDNITDHFRLQKPQQQALSRLGIETIHDLLYHFPMRYERAGDQTTVQGVAAGTDVILYGTIRNPEAKKSWKSKRPMSQALLEDGTGRIKLMWFNQPYIAKMLSDGAKVKISGRVEGKTSVYVANPEIEQVSELPAGGIGTIFDEHIDDDTLFAIYPESRGITSRWMRHAVAKILNKNVLEELQEVIPRTVLEKNKLPELQNAMVWIHQPKRESHKEAARKRFAFEEIFVLQIGLSLQRRALDREPSHRIIDGKKHAQTFIERFPFTLTKGQRSSIETILEDISSPPSMSRLLEGDVGSGKTAVAATIAYTVVKTAPKDRPSARLQVAYMAPTEILAEQHFESFVEYFGHLPIQMGLLTSSGCKKFPSKVDATKPTKISKRQLLSWVQEGSISILIGTHALIQKTVQFRDLGLVIIDEQHRFGTGQRALLVGRGKTRNETNDTTLSNASAPSASVPHLLSMTATPIPRTLALTLYGDLDLTVLDDMPPGRKQVLTKIVGKTERDEMYQNVRRELEAGRQVYVICPRIDEPDPQKMLAVQTRSVKEEAERLKRTEFQNYNVDILHGQMKPKEKEDTMRAFLDHDIDVLVATSVVEVGVNVPNATVIIIEGAERFGLAQLHQLRGRVVRSTHQSYCYALTSTGGVSARLKAFMTAKNGFELAERDLRIRGPGELHGRSQSGLTDLGMSALKNIKMVEVARTEAQRLVETDPELEEHPALKTVLHNYMEKVHFE